MNNSENINRTPAFLTQSSISWPDVIDICSNLTAFQDVQSLCERVHNELRMRLKIQRVEIRLERATSDYFPGFYGLEHDGTALSEPLSIETLQAEGFQLLIPVSCGASPLFGTIISDTCHSPDEPTLEMMRMIAMSMATHINALIQQNAASKERMLLKKLINKLPNFIYIKDPSSRIIIANQKMADVCGDVPDDMIGKSDFDYYPEPMAQQFFDDEQRIIKSGTPLLNHEENGLDEAGNPRCILTSKFPVKDEHGHVISLVGIGTDITEIKEYQLRLSESEERFRSLYDSIGDAVIAHNAAGKILDSNRAAKKMLSLSNEELIGRNIRDVDFNAYAEWLEEGLQDGQKQQLHFKAPDGRELSVYVRVSEFTYKDESAYLAVMRDVTELEEAKLETERAAKAKSEFLANMSHEIRTPLNAVIGVTSLLEDTEMDEEQTLFLKTIRTSGESLLDIVNDILDISKIEAGQLCLEKSLFSLRDCIENTLDIVARNAAEKQLEITYGIQGTPPDAFIGDEPRLRQILLNLLSNSIKFTEDGEVVLRVNGAALEDDEYRLDFCVSDTGIGMTQQQVASVFEPFKQADASTTRKYGGTGLGLSICNQLVQMMGGKLMVKSEVDKGSDFSFHIILKPAKEQPPLNATFDPKLLNGKKALIVDDNHTNLTILKYQLKKWGIESIGFENPEQVLSNYEMIKDCDLAIFDMAMPRMTGIELAQEMRRHETGHGMPLMILSSISRPKNIPKGVINAWMTKPAKFQLLGKQLCDMLLRQNQSSSVHTSSNEAIDHSFSKQFPLRILVAEDNRVNQLVITKLLNRFGYNPDLVEHGAKAVEAVCAKEYDLVLMDIQMPVMDGLEATRIIRERLDDATCPRIIALTAHAMQNDRQASLDVGMFDYLTKPVRLESLTEALKKVHQHAL